MKRSPLVGLAIVALVLFVALTYWALLGRKTEDAISLEPAAPATQPASVPSGLRLTKVDGALKLRPTGGAERELKVGDAIASSDEVLAGAGASGELSLQGASIAIGAETQVQFRGEVGDALQFFITGGNVRASAAATPIEFFAAGTSGRVRVQNAVARLLSDGSKGLVAYSERGDVYVDNAGQTIVLAAGQGTRIVAQKAPAPAWKLPSSLLLKVGWPKEGELAIRKLKLSGSVTPGALIRAQTPSGTPLRVLAAENGSFVVEIKLEEGNNDVLIQSDDVLGNREVAKHRIKVDTTPAEVGVETSPDMWKKRP